MMTNAQAALIAAAESVTGREVTVRGGSSTSQVVLARAETFLVWLETGAKEVTR